MAAQCWSGATHSHRTHAGASYPALLTQTPSALRVSPLTGAPYFRHMCQVGGQEKAHSWPRNWQALWGVNSLSPWEVGELQDVGFKVWP